MSRFWDLSPPISAQLPVWPGDVPYTREVRAAHARGDRWEHSAIRTTLHLGAHADAPRHVRAGAAGIDAVALAPYFGPCVVLAASAPPGGRVGPELLPDPLPAPRVLFRTDSYGRPPAFRRDFVGLAPALVAALAARGAVLVGIDTPSLDPFDDETPAAHRAAVEAGLAILEGLELAAVAPGVYHLAALPLRLVDADASPVRAVLTELPAPVSTPDSP